MPAPVTDIRSTAIEHEQRCLDAAERRRAEVVEEIEHQLQRPPRDAVGAHRQALLRTRLRALSDADQGLVLGRIDQVDGATYRIGRVGVPDPEGEPLVLDWRADAARAFYTATALDPQGLRRRRHIRTSGTRVVGVDDEDLTGGDAGDDELVGEAALLAALDERRSGHMRTAVATLQREQDAIVRAASEVPLVVQGGPGTGKTVVALHRVAYLLFTHPEIARRGVLVLGPSRRFLTYVEQVLPALGETAVVSTTCDDLLPGVAVEREESREIAEIKGRGLWMEALRRHVASMLPPVTDLTLVHDGEAHVLEAGRVFAALRSAVTGDRPFLQIRQRAFTALRDALVAQLVQETSDLVDSVEEGLEDILGTFDAALARADDRAVQTARSSSAVDGELDGRDVDTLRERVTDDHLVTRALEQWWPVPDPRTELERLLHDPAALAHVAPELSAAEVAAVVAEPGALAPSDIPLLDALAALLGGGVAAAVDPEPFLAARAAADRAWTYGHVVVDEAQELSAMQWHMVRRRCPTGSITAVGDIDQTEAPHAHTDWTDAVGPVLGDRWRRADLTICYRTPREVMELVEPVLASAGSRNAPPRAVRSSGHDPRVVTAAPHELAAVVRAEVAALRERYAGGSVGVVTAATHTDRLRAELAGVPVMRAVDAKGLEWDACVVVDPVGIAAAPRGWNALYVALTRCTQELVQVALDV